MEQIIITIITVVGTVINTVALAILGYLFKRSRRGPEISKEGRHHLGGIETTLSGIREDFEVERTERRNGDKEIREDLRAHVVSGAHGD